MSCQYEDKCCDDGSPLCKTCMHSEKRSYYVEYHEYPEEKWGLQRVAASGDDFIFPWDDIVVKPRP